MTDFIVAIPARYAASRLPGKPLRLLGGTPLVVHVARRVAEELPDGGLRITLRTPDPGSLRRLALRLGRDGRIVSPAALAGEAREAAVPALAGYGE